MSFARRRVSRKEINFQLSVEIEMKFFYLVLLSKVWWPEGVEEAAGEMVTVGTSKTYEFVAILRCARLEVFRGALCRGCRCKKSAWERFGWGMMYRLDGYAPNSSRLICHTLRR